MTAFVVAAYVVTAVVVGGYWLSVAWRSRQVDTELARQEGPD